MRGRQRPHCFVQDQIVIAARAIRAEREPDPVAVHQGRARNSGADATVAFRVEHRGRLVVGHELDVSIREPDAVSAGPALREHSEIRKMSNRGHAVPLLCQLRLPAGLEQMRVDAGIMAFGQFGAEQQRLIAAPIRIRRRRKNRKAWAAVPFPDGCLHQALIIPRTAAA